MGVRILEGREVFDGACLYCSTSMWAFGPIFEDAIVAQEFLDWLDVDPRLLNDKQLEGEYVEFLAHKEETKEAEDADNS